MKLVLEVMVDDGSLAKMAPDPEPAAAKDAVEAVVISVGKEAARGSRIGMAGIWTKERAKVEAPASRAARASS